MSGQKTNQYEYQSLNPNPSPEPNPHQVPNPYPQPPPYSPFPDQNSYLPNLPNTGMTGTQQTIYVQPMPSYPTINANPDIYQSNYGAIVQTVPQTVIFIGSCPACRVGILEDDFTCLGIFMALMFFPLGLICCLALRQKRCPNCGTTFD